MLAVVRIWAKDLHTPSLKFFEIVWPSQHCNQAQPTVKLNTFYPRFCRTQMTLQPVQQRTAHHITSRSCSTLSPSALTPPLPHGHHNNWRILAVLAMAAMDSWTIHSKGTFQEGGRLSAALSCWARCRAEKAPELLCCKRCFSWCLEHSLEALKKRPNELLKLLADWQIKCFFWCVFAFWIFFGT